MTSKVYAEIVCESIVCINNYALLCCPLMTFKDWNVGYTTVFIQIYVTFLVLFVKRSMISDRSKLTFHVILSIPQCCINP